MSYTNQQLVEFLREALEDAAIISDDSRPKDEENPMNQVRIHAILAVKCIMTLNGHRGGKYLRLSVAKPKLGQGKMEERILWKMNSEEYPNKMDMSFLSQVIRRIDQFPV